MSKPKKVLRHTHTIKYSSNEKYEEEDLKPQLKAEFFINAQKNRILCKLKDDRLQYMFESFMAFQGMNIIDDDDNEEYTSAPYYYDKFKMQNYYYQFLNEKEEFGFIGIAKCCPDDTFDITEGKNIALSKALDKRDKAINRIKSIIDKGITTSLGTVGDQLKYSVSKVKKD